VDSKTVFEATAYHTRNRLIEFWNDTQEYFDDQKAKMGYILCVEYLLGTSLENAVLNLDIEDNYREVRLIRAKKFDLFTRV
jgi:starch phosphorylase